MADQVEKYDPASFEPVWAQRWVDDELYKAGPSDDPRPRFYALDMFPYPSGDLHMGHLEAFTGGDIIPRYWWMRGYNVLHPIGWDAFGLPAENAALKRGIHPKEWTYANITQQESSFKRLGISFDWSRRVNTCDPEYYKWTQWLFIKFFERGLAYRKAAPANWCPNDQTVLANEQVVNGKCERCGAVVEKRDLVQWFFRITDYADRLLDDMSLLEGWTDRVLTMQRNWIGRSEGARVTFTIAETDQEIEVFTTRPDTLWGVTFFVLAPEHPLAAELAARAGKQEEFREYLARVRRTSDIDRTAAGRHREGLFLDAHVTNPVNGERVPVLASDHVLMEYGTGAVMGVPAHDQRDFEFARQYGLPIRIVIAPPGKQLDPEAMTEAWPHDGVMMNSGPFDGRSSDGIIAAVTQWLEEQGLGKQDVNYRLRDWLLSRQRYWGAPIPIIHCPACGEVAVPEDQLPVLLPDDVDFSPQGESPLAKHEGFMHVSCPRCGGDARRDADTMDTFVDSSWYFLRYLSPNDGSQAFSMPEAAAWMPVSQYTGGIEHAILHLLYSRFFTKVLHDMDLVPFVEPFINLMNQGQVIMEGAAMSKSKGNLVAPAEIIDSFGADTARATMMFAGPFEADVDWADVSPQGMYRWLSRVWRIVLTNADRIARASGQQGESALRKATHRTIDGVTHDMERFRFNTAIAKLMTLANEISDADASDADIAEAIDALLHMLAPTAPFITEELWHRLGNSGSIHMSSWPVADPALVRQGSVTCVVQVNGKVRERLDVAPSATEDELRETALGLARIQDLIAGKEIARIIVVPPKLVNIVVR
ncbi:MAG: leucine--tRNA ligase [Actinomycetota bacterium]